MEKIKIEIEYDKSKDFDISKAIKTAWKEFGKCEVLDVIEKGNRTKYGEL